MERISTITGKPVRKYSRKSVKVEEIIEKKEEDNYILKKEDFVFYRDTSFDKNYDFKTATIKRKNYDSYTLYFNYGPTVNCQMMSVGAFGNFLKKETKVLEQLKVIKDNFHKNILLIDIREEYMKYFNEKIPQELVIMVSPYKSTNGSNMNICLINMKNL